ncbi:MAG: fibronectin type III domain-containing protein [Ramlibacter sp.]|jgi:poly(3-hydroxybutyrate) depolymerase
MTFKLMKLFAAVTALSAGAAMAAVNLPAYNVDTSKTTVSGLSSGGFMANQLGIAYSSLFKGVGVFAAGPYMCAGLSNYTACMYNASISSTALANMQSRIDTWSGTQIDNKANIAGQKVYLFVGTSDTTVGQNPVTALKTQYTNNGVSAANLDHVVQSGASHTFPTDFDSTGNNSCGSAASPYISNCSYDGAKAVLQKFYGTLNPRNNVPAASNYIEFNQTEFTSNPGMAATGWLYVPASCASGTQCKVHVALHGCQQSTDKIGDKFVKNTGYTRWADTNNIIVLFPQTKTDNTSRSTAASGSLANPNACWDWIGWYGTNFAQKAGTQMAAIKAMVDRVSSGSGSGGGGGGTTTLAAPTGVATSNATTSSMQISWSAVSGAASYNVYRNSNKTNALPVTATSYTDTGLAAATQYSWTVRAADANGVEGATSAAATGTTTGTAPPPATCYTSSNYAHTTAGRATQSGGYTYAKGSSQNMGLWNTFTTTTLKMTGPNYYVIGTCP